MPGAPASRTGTRWDDPRIASTRFTDVRRFATLDSTNRFLLEAATQGGGVGLVAVADEQTAGRGRLGREWHAPPKASLLASVLLRPALAPDQWHVLTLACALAAIDAVRGVAAIDARLKWPNDVVVGDRKLAGILAEASGGALVVGMGLNVRWDAFPPELAATATACNLCSEVEVGVDDVLAAWLVAFDARLDALDEVLADAAACSATLGRRVRVELPGETFEGVADALTPEGYLVVARDDGAPTVVTSGDVVHLRLAGT